MRFAAKLALVLSASVAPLAGPALAGTPSAWAGPGPSSVLPLGDSLTLGVSWAGYDLPVSQVTTPGGYRGYLYQDLAGQGFSISYTGSEDVNPPLGTTPSEFRHEGHAGYRIDQLEGGLPKWARLILTSPSVVVVMAGTNDLSEGYDPARSYPGGYDETLPAERAQFVADAVGRLEGLVGEVARLYHPTRIVLCTIPPMGITSPDPADTDYDQALRTQVIAWAARHRFEVVLADVGKAFMAQPTYHDLIGPDGVHPTPLGYQLMASVIASAISPS